MFGSQYNRDRYCSYFCKLKDRYLRSTVLYLILLLAEITFLIIREDRLKTPIITTVAILVVIFSIIQLIAYIFRLCDVSNIEATGYEIKNKHITVERIKSKEVNSTYCTIYLDYIGIKLEIGKKYRICYLTRSFGKYIVDVEEIKEASNNE